MLSDYRVNVNCRNADTYIRAYSASFIMLSEFCERLVESIKNDSNKKYFAKCKEKFTEFAAILRGEKPLPEDFAKPEENMSEKALRIYYVHERMSVERFKGGWVDSGWYCIEKRNEKEFEKLTARICCFDDKAKKYMNIAD